MSTIRFEDLGDPIKKLLNQLKGGYTEADMQLMEYVSVKDMAKIYNDLNSQKEAKKIWKELKAELTKRKEKIENAEGQIAENAKKVKKIQKDLEDQAEKDDAEERDREERKKKRAEKRERKRREAEQAEAEAEAEAAALADAEAAEEEKQRAKEARRKRREELERQAEEEAAEEARLEEERVEEKRAKKAEKKRMKAEAERLRVEQEELEEAMRLKKQKEKASLADKWAEYVKDHPLEFGGDEDTGIVQVSVERKTGGPPKEFLKLRGIKITSVDEREEAAFYKLQVHLKNGTILDLERRYSQFSDMRIKLGGTLEVVDAPFPGKTFMKVRGAALEKRREELELWINTLIRKLENARSYAGVQLDSKQQLRGDAARAEAERQRMGQAALSRQALYDFLEITA